MPPAKERHENIHKKKMTERIDCGRLRYDGALKDKPNETNSEAQ